MSGVIGSALAGQTPARRVAARTGARSSLRKGVCALLAAALLPLLAWPAPAGAQYGPALDLDVPFVTTPDNVVLKMLEMTGIRTGDRLIDLGSGDGRIVITAALRFKVPGFGVEIDPSLVKVSNDNAARAGVGGLAKFAVQDLFDTDLSQATVITMYLLPDVNLQLRPRLLKLAPGTRLVSHDWTMGDWPPDRTEVVDAPEKKLGFRKVATLMTWTVPANVSGVFHGRDCWLELRQQYAQVTGGTLVLQGRRYTVLPATVAGADVGFTARSDDGHTLSWSASVARQPGAGSPIEWTVRDGSGAARRLLTRRD